MDIYIDIDTHTYVRIYGFMDIRFRLRRKKKQVRTIFFFQMCSFHAKKNMKNIGKMSVDIICYVFSFSFFLFYMHTKSE